MALFILTVVIIINYYLLSSMCILHQHNYQISFRYIKRRFGFLGKLELHFCWTFFSYVAKIPPSKIPFEIEIGVTVGLFFCLHYNWRNDLKRTSHHTTDLTLLGHHAYWETNIHSTVSSWGIWWTHRYWGKCTLSPGPAFTISFNIREHKQGQHWQLQWEHYLKS